MRKWLLLPIALIYAILPLSINARDSLKIDENSGDHSIIHDEAQIKVGKRLFYGFVKTAGTQVNCAGCHNTGYIDTLNWNPSAYDISTLYKNKDLSGLKTALMNPGGIKLSEVHKGIDLDSLQLISLKSYIDSLAVAGPPMRKPLAARLLLFILSFVLALLITLDLLLFKKIPYKLVHIILLLGLGGWQLKVIVDEAIALGRSRDYAPQQPIKFSHKVHAGANQIDCKYCHHTAENSKSANIPSANVCLNCHIIVREGSHSGKHEINKIHKAVETGKPIAWIKIHNLPDHVFFSHAQHVSAGKVDCRECHGPVENMDVVQQYSDLSMGFCIKCHREKEVQFFDNAFYSKWEELHRKMKAGEIKKVTPDLVGGTDCMKCHY